MTDNPVEDFRRLDAEQALRYSKLPLCDRCGKRIEDEYFYQVLYYDYCEDCMNKLFRKAVEIDEV